MSETANTPCCQEIVRIPLIGEKAPSFEATTTQGKISFPDDYKGKWVILFSHPADWRPGERVIVPPPGSCGQAAERVAGAGQGYECQDWFLCFKNLPE